MSFNFSPEAGIGKSQELIPNGTLTYAVIEVKGVKNSKTTTSRYIECELTVTRAPFENRKVFTKIGDPTHDGNSEAYQQMGLQALTRIFESKGIFRHGDLASYRHFDGATIEQIAANLEGGDVPIKIKIEKGKDGHADKNDIGDWLSPNPESNCAKTYQQLLAGPKVAPAGGAFGTAAPTGIAPVAQPPSFAQQQQVAAPVANGAPSWLNHPAAQPAVAQPTQPVAQPTKPAA